MQIGSDSGLSSSISQFLTGNVPKTPVQPTAPATEVKKSKDTNSITAQAAPATAQKPAAPSPNARRGSVVNLVV